MAIYVAYSNGGNSLNMNYFDITMIFSIEIDLICIESNAEKSQIMFSSKMDESIL